MSRPPRRERYEEYPDPRDRYRYVPGPRSYETSRRPTSDRFADEGSGRLLPFMLALAVFLFMIAFSFWQVTDRDNAVKLLEPAVSRITEIDTLLPRVREQMETQVAEEDLEVVYVPNYPILVPVTAEQLRLLSDQELLAYIERESALLTYEHGLNVFAQDGSLEGGFFSTEGMLRLTYGQITAGRHDQLTITVTILAIITLLLVAGQLWAASGWGRLVSLGAMIAVAAIPSLIIVALVRFGLATLADDQSDPLIQDLLDIWRKANAIPFRNYMAVSAFGLVLIVLGWMGAWLTGFVSARMGKASPIPPAEYQQETLPPPAMAGGRQYLEDPYGRDPYGRPVGPPAPRQRRPQTGAPPPRGTRPRPTQARRPEQFKRPPGEPASPDTTAISNGQTEAAPPRVEKPAEPPRPAEGEVVITQDAEQKPSD